MLGEPAVGELSVNEDLSGLAAILGSRTAEQTALFPKFPALIKLATINYGYVVLSTGTRSRPPRVGQRDEGCDILRTQER
jgi:hypothetical protein